MKKILTTCLFFISGMFLFAQEQFNPMLFTNTDVTPVQIDLAEEQEKYPGMFPDYEGAKLYRESYGENSFLRYLIPIPDNTEYEDAEDFCFSPNYYLMFYYETEEGPVLLESRKFYSLEDVGKDYSYVYSNIMVLHRTESIGYMRYYITFNKGEMWDEYWNDDPRGTEQERRALEESRLNIAKAKQMVKDLQWEALNDSKFFDIYSNTAGVFFISNEELEEIKGNTPEKGDLVKKAYTRCDIAILASRPLIDKTNPFRYTIQNAFDQNPATSFVENTDDDLMELEFLFDDSFREGIHLNNGFGFIQQKIINGYAQNESLYLANNRIKSFWNIQLEDNKLDYQYIGLKNEKGNEWKIEYGFTLRIKEIFKGTKYNDTCLAEIDLQYPNKLWLFGGYNE